MKDKQTRRVLLEGVLKDGLYQFKPSPNISGCNQKHSPYFLGVLSVSKSSVAKPTNIYISKKDVWHRRLGHPSSKVLNLVCESNNVKISKHEIENFCEAC